METVAALSLGKERPDVVLSIEDLVKKQEEKNQGKNEAIPFTGPEEDSENPF